MKMRAIDLFAGIGGIRLGFDQAFGDVLDTVFVSEWDVKAQETYRANFGEIPEVQGDITCISEEDIPGHDLLLAGFPCQAFSIAGQRKGFEDTRGTLFFDVARIVAHHQPKMVFIENVKNFARHDKGKTFGVVRQVLQELGYTVFDKVLNSKDFGLPQHRERIYIVAFHASIAPETFTFPTPQPTTPTLNNIIEPQAVSNKYYLSEQYLTSLKNHRQRHEEKGHGFGYQVRELTDIAGALVCGGMGRERNLIVDTKLTDLTPVTSKKGGINKELVRSLTPREWARLQGFPDSFVLPVADSHLYKQFGNSVSVPVIKAIATEIRKQCFSNNS